MAVPTTTKNSPNRHYYLVRGRPSASDRPALPPGHPVTWGAITSGTVLDQAAYPYPVFDR